MSDRPWTKLTAPVLGAPDPSGLASFYEHLLGWQRGADEDDWVTVLSPDGSAQLSFQLESDHVPPVWPAGPADQQMQLHLDVEVRDLDAAGAWAEKAGAVLADFQPQDDVRVYLDPAGHPFCLWVAEG